MYTNEKINVAKYVTEHLQSHEVIGFGAGSTVNIVIENLKSGTSFITASYATSDLLISKGKTVLSFDGISSINYTVDGADLVIVKDSEFWIIKGHGGALLKEKILWELSDNIDIVVDNSKLSEYISTYIPIEIIPYSRHSVTTNLNKIFGKNIDISLRIVKNNMPFITENGNYILDLYFKDKYINLVKLNRELICIPGIVETGIFIRKRDNRARVIVGHKDRVELIV